MKEAFFTTADLHDTDANGYLRPSAVLRTMQNAANAQMHRHGMDPAQLLAQSGKAFLLSSLHMEIYHSICAYDSLCAYAWPCESKGCRFLRCGQLWANGRIVAELSAVWALLEMQERKLLRVNDFAAPFDCDPPLELSGAVRIPLPQSMEAIGQYQVAYRDVDVHRHMNNTCYPDLLLGYCPEAQEKQLCQIEIVFSKEAPLGETLQIFSSQSETKERIFRTLRWDGSENTRAVLSFARL